jgi:hypothetical protein
MFGDLVRFGQVQVRSGQVGYLGCFFIVISHPSTKEKAD